MLREDVPFSTYQISCFNSHYKSVILIKRFYINLTLIYSWDTISYTRRHWMIMSNQRTDQNLYWPHMLDKEHNLWLTYAVALPGRAIQTLQLRTGREFHVMESKLDIIFNIWLWFNISVNLRKRKSMIPCTLNDNKKILQCFTYEHIRSNRSRFVFVI